MKSFILLLTLLLSSCVVDNQEPQYENDRQMFEAVLGAWCDYQERCTGEPDTSQFCTGEFIDEHCKQYDCLQLTTTDQSINDCVDYYEAFSCEEYPDPCTLERTE